MKKLKGERQRKSVLKWPHYSYCRVLVRGTQPLKDMVSLEE
jgi:hypothetical protein